MRGSRGGGRGSGPPPWKTTSSIGFYRNKQWNHLEIVRMPPTLQNCGCLCENYSFMVNDCKTGIHNSKLNMSFVKQDMYNRTSTPCPDL